MLFSSNSFYLMLISQLILVPVFAVVIWGYFHFTANYNKHRFSDVYDALIVCLAITLSLLFANQVYSLNYDAYVRTWKPVFAVLSSVHIFPLTMLAGVMLKKKLRQIN
jgi:purine-cytosine permease-like protein